MPYTCKRKSCKKSDGSNGFYVMVKDSTGEEVSCHSSKEDCESAARAIMAEEHNKQVTDITKTISEIKKRIS